VGSAKGIGKVSMQLLHFSTPPTVFLVSARNSDLIGPLVPLGR
jgi:hypothetical protein